MKQSHVALLLPFFALCGCSGGDDSQEFLMWTTNWGAEGTTVFAFEGENFAFLAYENHSGGEDLNGDGSLNDTVPVVVNAVTKNETLLEVAVANLVWVGEHLYLEVLESEDEWDWNGSNGDADRVLLHWQEGMDVVEYVDTLDATDDLVLLSMGDLGFYASDSAQQPFESTLRVLGSSSPTAGVIVPTDEDAAGLDPELIALEDGMLFLGLDETKEGLDLNDDGDVTDTRVLALLDATGALGMGLPYDKTVKSTRLAAAPGDAPLFAESTGSGDWIVAFLVDESSQSDALLGLNHPDEVQAGTFTPCSGIEDLDQDDDVLHFLEFNAWSSDPLGDPVVNAGLVGSDRILFADGYLGTICIEADEQGCDLNNDGDMDDRVFRWVLADPGNLDWENNPNRIHALPPVLTPPQVGGGTHGVAVMGDRFVIVVNEEEDNFDHDLDSLIEDRNLIAHLKPSLGGGWTFHHDTEEDGGWVVPTWMGEIEGSNRLGVGVSESSNHFEPTSSDPSPMDLNGDEDEIDSVPTWAQYGLLHDEVTPGMIFPGYGIALDQHNAGIIQFGDWGLYRVSESENGGDLNSNGGGHDYLLWRTHLKTGQTFNMSMMNSLESPAVIADVYRASIGAFLVDEGDAGDVNGDGDTSGFAVKYFQF